ncbi:MAG TPA: cyanophycinase [Polyangia bacterium]|jgi:cyanophycinase
MSPSRVRPGHQRGFIIPVGGAEDKTAASRILKRFVSLCGGRHAAICVVPTASALADTGARYERVFHDLGVGRVTVADIATRADAGAERVLAALEGATGIFLTGGSQLRLSTILGGTVAAQAIRRANAAGVHVAGTSAGAGFVSDHMIAFGKEGGSPGHGMVTLAPGLGLTNRIVVDQHFRQRDRLGRLLTAIGYNPFLVGIGLDEDTAAFIGPDDVLEVVGSGAITIVDGGSLEFSSMASAHEGKPVCLTNIVVHVLIDGGSYDPHRRKADPGAAARRRESA